jgi:hypothetical protein
MEFDIDRPGQDFQNFDLQSADPALCQGACSQNPQCKAWTYVKPNTTQGPNPRCWLKSGVPPTTPSSCCVSGVKIGASTGGGSSGGSGGTSSGTGGTTNPGSLQLVEVTQDPKCSSWDNITSCNPNGGQITWGDPTNTNYQWNSPPQQVGAEGFTITMSVSEQNPPENRSATGIGMDGGGFELDPPDARIPIGAPNQPMSGSLTVKVKPPRNPSGDYYLKIGAYWGPGFTYHYRVVR